MGLSVLLAAPYPCARRPRRADPGAASTARAGARKNEPNPAQFFNTIGVKPRKRAGRVREKGHAALHSDPPFTHCKPARDRHPPAPYGRGFGLALTDYRA